MFLAEVDIRRGNLDRLEARSRQFLALPKMNRLPQKVSLVSQTAAVLVEEIESGRWASWLPGEHELCAQLHVSRKTLRAALTQLSRKGVIKCSQGRRRRIADRRATTGATTSNRVLTLLPLPPESLNPLAIYLINRLREHLTEAGYVLETHVSRAPYRGGGNHGLESLTKTMRPAGWVLFGPTQSMQQWFATRELPCVVVGSCYEGIRLPAVDRDYAAVCHHAVNQFILRGHRRLVLLTPAPGPAGDLITMSSFREAVAESKVTDVFGTVQEHDGSVASICARVQHLLSRPQPPTAFLISRARHVLTVLGHLLSTGVRVPQNVALISRDDDSFLEDVVPSVARYSHSHQALASKISRVVMGIVQGDAQIKDYTIMPTFIKGQTLG